MDKPVSNLLLPLNWQKEHGGPLYMQLSHHIENVVREGVLKPDDAFPSEREVASITDISRVTVRKAFRKLVSDGIIVQKRGSGTFVAPNIEKIEQSLSHLTSFTEDMHRRGKHVTSHFIDKGQYQASPEEMMRLGLAAGDMVSRIARLRLANNVPMAIERAALPVDILPDPELVEDSLYAELSKSNNKPTKAIQRISAANINDVDAELLEVEVGDAGLIIERISFLNTGKVIEFTSSVYRGDAYDFVAELKI